MIQKLIFAAMVVGIIAAAMRRGKAVVKAKIEASRPRRLRLRSQGRKVLIVLLALGALFALWGCGGKVEPKAEMPVIQITDNRVITIHQTTLQGDNNIVKTDARVEAEVKPVITAEPELKQEAELTTKSGMWIVWLVLIGLALAAGAYLYIKNRR